MQTRRLFFGLTLSPALVKRLSREMEGWPDELCIKTRPENLHVTLQFLGFVNEEEIPRLTQSMERVAAEYDLFDLSFDAVKLAPTEDNPSMVWLTGDPSDSLLELKNALNDELGSYADAAKSFRPHIALAKIRRSRWRAASNQPTIEKSLSLVEPIAAVTLFESTTVNGKRTYLKLTEFPLGK